jgi:hypothetical protein
VDCGSHRRPPDLLGVLIPTRSDTRLEPWNFAGDLATSIGSPWPDRGQLADRCYRKLVAANVPYVFDLTRYQPRWLAHELRCVRQLLNNGVHLLRAALS